MPTYTVDTAGSTAELSSILNGVREYTLTGMAHLMDGSPQRPSAEAYIRVKDGRIAESGYGTPRGSDSTSTTVEIRGGAIVPGFVDPHIHLGLAAQSTSGTVDCNVDDHPSIDAIVGELVDNLPTADAREGWLIGRANLFTDQRLVDRRLPDRRDLDKVSTTIPIALRCGAHVTILNSAALERLSERLGDEELRGDASVELGEGGTPTGEIHELFHRLDVPSPSQDELEDELARLSRDLLLANGVTTLGEISDSRDMLESVLRLHARGDIQQTAHLYLTVPWAFSDTTEALEWLDGRPCGLTTGPEAATVRGIKLFIDGGFSAKGAATLMPYTLRGSDTQPNYGRLAYGFDDLVAILHEAEGRGLDVLAHANGERAQWLLCSAAMGVESRRTMIRAEHGLNWVSQAATVQIFKDAAVTPVPQASFIWHLAPFLPNYLGAAAERGRMSFRRYFDEGMPVGVASDATGSEMKIFAPLFNMALTMDRHGCNGDPVEPDQAVTFAEALWMHTKGAAAAMGLDGAAGALTKDSAADWVILSNDPGSSNDLSRTAVWAVARSGALAWTAAQ